MKREKQSDWIRQWLADGVLVSAAATLSGMFTNIMLLFGGYLVSLVIAHMGVASRVSEWDAQTQWIVLSFFSLAVSGFGMGIGCSLIGGRAAQFRSDLREREQIDLPLLSASMALGLLLHGGAVLFVTLTDIAYLFFAGPVPYLARFLGHGERTLFAADGLRFSTEIFVEAVLLYLLLITAFGVFGYVRGYRREITKILKHEADEKLYEREHREMADRDDSLLPPPDFHPKTLESRTEGQYLRMNRAEQLRTVLAFCAWIGADTVLWFLWMKTTGRELLSPYNVGFVALAVLPFYPFRWHERFLGAMGYAVVAMIKTKEEVNVAKLRADSRGPMVRTKQFAVVYFRRKDGETVERSYAFGRSMPYRIGDHVLMLPAFRYPVNCSCTKGEFCPRCGTVSPAKSRVCYGCRRKMK